MYREDLIPAIKKGINVSENLQIFYYSNFGLIKRFKAIFGVRPSEEEDFEQLCFIACHKAVQAFDVTHGDSILSYYRRCVQHEFYMYKLETRFVLHVPRDKYKDAVNQGLGFPEDLDSIVYSYARMDENLEKVENDCIASILWEILREDLDDFSYELIYRNYKKRESMTSLSRDLGIEYIELRKLQRKALRRLRADERVQKCAQSYFGII